MGFTEAVAATSRFLFHVISNVLINIPHLPLDGQTKAAACPYPPVKYET